MITIIIITVTTTIIYIYIYIYIYIIYIYIYIYIYIIYLNRSVYATHDAPGADEKFERVLVTGVFKLSPILQKTRVVDLDEICSTPPVRLLLARAAPTADEYRAQRRHVDIHACPRARA
jgi:hypothetical protein